MASELTQIPFSDPYQSCVNMEQSFISQTSMAATNTSQMEALSKLHDSVIQNSPLMSLVQSLPTTKSTSLPINSTVTPQINQQQQSTSQASLYYHGHQDSQEAVTPVSQSAGALWPGQPNLLRDASNTNSLFSSNDPNVMLHPPVQRSEANSQENVLPHHTEQSFHEGQGQKMTTDNGHLTSQGHNESIQHFLHNASFNTSTGKC